MAITGRFDADFENFFTACEQADVSLKGFETGAGKVETQLNKMADSFSGRKVISEATLMVEAVERVGGVSTLTEKELARVGATANEAANKLRAMGQDVPPGIQKIADESTKAQGAQKGLGDTVKEVALGFAAMFTARAAINFVGDILEDASALKDLSAQTHISVEELQVLSGAVSEFGIDADELGKGLFTLSRKVAGGDESVARALAVMGMSLKDVEGLQGQELFLKMEHGLSTLQGSLRDTTATDLFGSKLGAAMGGASDGIDGALESWKKLNHVVSTESNDAMDQYGETIARTEQNLKSMAASMIGPIAEGFNVLSDAAGKGASKWEIAKAVATDFFNSTITGKNDASALATVLDDLNVKTEANTKATQGEAGAHREAGVALTQHEQAARFMATLEENAGAALDAWQLKSLAHLKEIGQLNAANALAIGVSGAQFAKYSTDQTALLAAQKAAQSEAAAAAKKYNDALVELGAAGAGWQGTLASMNKDTADSVRWYLEAGVSQGALATAYGLTAVQVKAVAESLAAEQVALKAEAAGVLEVTKLWNEYDELKVAHGGSSTDAQIAQIDRWAADLTAKMVKAGTDTEEFYTALAATTEEKLSAVRVNWSELSTHSQQALQEVADKALATYATALNATGQFTTEYLETLRTAAEQSQETANGWPAAIEEVVPPLKAVADEGKKVEQQFVAIGMAILSATEKAAAFENLNAMADRNMARGDASGISAIIGMGQRDAAMRIANNLPSFAQGGSGDFGSGTPVMLHGKETIVPWEKGGASSTINVSINIAGGASDPARAGREAADALLARLMQRGVRI